MNALAPFHKKQPISPVLMAWQYLLVEYRVRAAENPQAAVAAIKPWLNLLYWLPIIAVMVEVYVAIFSDPAFFVKFLPFASLFTYLWFWVMGRGLASQDLQKALFPDQAPNPWHRAYPPKRWEAELTYLLSQPPSTPGKFFFVPAPCASSEANLRR